MGREGGLIAFSPYIDGVTIPRSPLDVMREATTAEIPLLLGSNRDEWTLFELFVGERTVTPFARRPAIIPESNDRADVRPVSRGATGRTDAQAWIELIGHVAFRIPVIRLAAARSAHQRGVFMYRFDWASPAFRQPARRGARPSSSRSCGTGSICRWRRSCSPRMWAQHSLWPPSSMRPGRGFIRSGGSEQGPGLPAWPAYDPGAPRCPSIAPAPSSTIRVVRRGRCGPCRRA
ncbi:MAG: carboxylesterase family protein [Myxococcales bacterium]|nr:carboxylesterase family protein [Myxococcales bacterium]